MRVQQAAGSDPGVPVRRASSSMIMMSQLLLGAIARSEGSTLAALRKELRSAGYEVSRQRASRAGEREASAPEAKGMLLRVTGSDDESYFRIWKVPSPLLAQRGCSCGRMAPRPRRPLRRRSKRKAAKKAREAWRRKANKRARFKAKDPACARASVGARARVMGQERGQTSSDGHRKQRSQKERRPSSWLREEKRREPERSVKQTIQKPRVVNSECPYGVQKARTKADAPRDVVRSPSGALAGPSGH